MVKKSLSDELSTANQESVASAGDCRNQAQLRHLCPGSACSLGRAGGPDPPGFVKAFLKLVRVLRPTAQFYQRASVAGSTRGGPNRRCLERLCGAACWGVRKAPLLDFVPVFQVSPWAPLS